MVAVVPILGFRFYKPNVGLVHQSSRLKCLTRSFMREPLRSQHAQLFTDQRKQFIRSLRISALNCIQNACDITHACSLPRLSFLRHTIVLKVKRLLKYCTYPIELCKAWNKPEKAEKW